MEHRKAPFPGIRLSRRQGRIVQLSADALRQPLNRFRSSLQLMSSTLRSWCGVPPVQHIPVVFDDTVLQTLPPWLLGPGFDSCLGCECVRALTARTQSLGDCQGALEHGGRLYK